MKSKKPERKSKKEKTESKRPISHKELLEKLSGLEVELEPEETDMEEENKSSENFSENPDLNFNGINSSLELSRLLSSHIPQRNDFEVFSGELEGAVSSAPRISVGTGNTEIKDMKYNETNYNADLYKKKASEYESNTPNYAGRPSGPGSESGTSNRGQDFQSHTGKSGSAGGEQ